MSSVTLFSYAQSIALLSDWTFKVLASLQVALLLPTGSGHLPLYLVQVHITMAREWHYTSDETERTRRHTLAFVIGPYQLGIGPVELQLWCQVSLDVVATLCSLDPCTAPSLYIHYLVLPFSVTFVSTFRGNSNNDLLTY